MYSWIVVKPGFHVIARIASDARIAEIVTCDPCVLMETISKTRSDRCDSYVAILASFAVLAIIWKPGLVVVTLRS